MGKQKNYLVRSDIFSKIILLFLISGGLALTSSAFADGPGRLVSVVPSKVFIPANFDDNDHVQVVLSGFFDDSCYRIGRLRIREGQQKNTFIVRDEAHYYDHAPCLDVRVKYQKTIEMGQMDSGQYKFLFVDSDRVVQKVAYLKVAASQNTGPDDHFYAPIENSLIYEVMDQNVLIVNGQFTNSCLKLKEVRVLRSQKDLFEVLPIAEYQGSNEVCADVMVPFSKRLTLPKDLRGDVLFHIRVMNGRALNKVHSFTNQ